MVQPIYPVKFGVYLETSLREYEHFVAHILDVAPSPENRRLITYEVPLGLMVHNRIENKLVQFQGEEDFKCKGLSMSLESSMTSSVPKEPIEMQI